jgi:Flp pilus assembly protein TadD
MEQARRMDPQADFAGETHPVWTAAIEHHRRGDTGAAIALYQRYLKINPHDPCAWLNLGAALRRTRCLDAALVCYQRVLRLRPLDAGVWSNLGNLWQDLEQHEQSLRAHRRAVELAPGHFGLRVSYARALREAGCFEKAQEQVEQCLEHEPGHADLLWERAVLCLHAGRFSEAWPDYEARLRTGAVYLPKLRSSRWQGERIGGKRLLLLAEQGFGDLLWAARYLGMLRRRGADLSLACSPLLHPLFAGLDVHLIDAADPALAARVFDFHCPMMSLPGLVDPRGHCIPEPLAVSVPTQSRVLMKRRVAPHARSLRIGLVWSGSTAFAGNARRAVPLARFLPLAAMPGVQLFSLQKGKPAAQLNTSGAGGFIVDLAPRCSDFGDTAAAIEQMDLIVTPDCGVAHLAGCLDKPILNLLQYKPCWIYGMRGEATPSYPTMRLIRQKSPGNWDSVFEELVRLVGNWADVRERQQHAQDTV